MADIATVFGAGVIFGTIATFLVLYFISREIDSRTLPMRRVTREESDAVINGIRDGARDEILHELCKRPLCDDCKRSIG